jgi:hypothetical protein
MNEPNVTPVAVGGGVGSTVPVFAVPVITPEKSYIALNDCEKPLRPKNKMLEDSKYLIILINFIGTKLQKIEE